MKRILVRTVLVLIAICVIGVVLAGVFVDGILKTGIEAGGSSAMGVTTQVKTASLGLMSGTLNLGDLDVANPEGFEGHFLHLNEAEVEVSLASLLSDTVEVPTFRLDGLDVTLFKYKGGSNYESILDHMGGDDEGGDESNEGDSSDSSGGKQFVIRNLELTNITVHVSFGLGDNELVKADLTIPKIQLKDVGSSSGGADLKEIMSTVVQALLKAVAENGVDLPAALLNDLKGRLANLDSLEDLGFAVSGDVSQSVKDAAQDLQDATKSATENLPGELGDLIPADASKDVNEAIDEGIKGLFKNKDD